MEANMYEIVQILRVLVVGIIRIYKTKNPTGGREVKNKN